jgi:hypothetical protein
MLQCNDSGATRGEMREMTTSATAMVVPEHITLVLTLPTVHWADRHRPATVRLTVTCISHYKPTQGNCELSPTRPLEQGHMRS